MTENHRGKNAAFISLCVLSLLAFGAQAREPVSHRAIYDIALASTNAGAAGVVNAHGKLSNSLQKVCDHWETEGVFSLDVGYETAGLETTNWKQTTRESADGCFFEFDVFVREKGKDRKELSGKAVCDNKGKKKVALSFPVKSQAVFPNNVAFPVQQTLRLLQAAQKGERNVSSYVFDGTKPDALYFMNAVITQAPAFKSEKVKENDSLLAGKKAYRFDAAFFQEFTHGKQDGTPLYEVSLYYYENGLSDHIEQDFGKYRLRSTLVKLEPLKDIPCPSKNKRQTLTSP